jgi:hypothetical protein
MEIVLGTKLTMVVRDEDTDKPVRAVLVREESPKMPYRWILKVQQQFADGSWAYMSSGWYLHTLVTNWESPDKIVLEYKDDDRIYVDFGQKWGVKGIGAAINDALLKLL